MYFIKAYWQFYSGLLTHALCYWCLQLSQVDLHSVVSLKWVHRQFFLNILLIKIVQSLRAFIGIPRVIFIELATCLWYRRFFLFDKPLSLCRRDTTFSKHICCLHNVQQTRFSINFDLFIYRLIPSVLVRPFNDI